VWDLAPEGGGEGATVAGSGGLDFSPDGRLLAVGSESGRVRVYDAASGAIVRDVRLHTAKVDGVAFSNDGSLLATASSDGSAKIFDLSADRVVWTIGRQKQAGRGIQSGRNGCGELGR
jgi:WD40 repeat protein